jgi:hypothetical protein
LRLAAVTSSGASRLCAPPLLTLLAWEGTREEKIFFSEGMDPASSITKFAERESEKVRESEGRGAASNITKYT